MDSNAGEQCACVCVCGAVPEQRTVPYCLCQQCLAISGECWFPLSLSLSHFLAVMEHEYTRPAEPSRVGGMFQAAAVSSLFLSLALCAFSSVTAAAVAAVAACSTAEGREFG